MSTRSDAIEDEALPRRMLARVLGLQYVVGGALTAAWVLVPQFGPAQGHAAVLSLAVIALVLGAAMGALSFARVGGHTLLLASHACILSSQVVIALVHAATGTTFGPMLLFFLWTTPYAAVFSARARALHMSSSAVAMTASVLAVPASGYERTASIVFILAAMVSITVLVSRLTWALRRQASTDALTGLPNRRAFHAATRAALARSRAHGTQVFVLLIDLDRFKNINDTYGHHAGDALLQQIAPRLRAELRAGHLVARLGGDEFAVLGEDHDLLVEVEAVAERLGRVCARPVQLPQGQVVTTASIGVALADDGDTADTLLRNADSAMYAAKAAGAATSRVYDRQMHEASAYAMHLESELRAAVSAGQLHLAYQPVVGLGGERATGAEALVRWTHPVHGPIGPAEFIPLAETTGVIAELGHWVLRQALADLARWRRTGAVDDGFCVAVNVSAAQLTEQFPDEVAQLLAASQVPARCLGIELTESAVMAGQGAEQTLRRLRELGIVLLLDDFGTGYSSLSHLLQFSFDTIKIDRSFVAGVAQPSAQRTIVLAILSLARSLDKHVVAEGVETSEQAAQLRQAGCSAAQGYLFSRPVPAEELPGVVARLDGVTGSPSAAALARAASSTAAVMRDSSSGSIQVPAPRRAAETSSTITR